MTRVPIITYGFLLVSEMEPPTITGRSGKIHGTKAVSTPAIKDISKREIILLYISDYCGNCSAALEFCYHTFVPGNLNKSVLI